MVDTLVRRNLKRVWGPKLRGAMDCCGESAGRCRCALWGMIRSAMVLRPFSASSGSGEQESGKMPSPQSGTMPPGTSVGGAHWMSAHNQTVRRSGGVRILTHRLPLNNPYSMPKTSLSTCPLNRPQRCEQAAHGSYIGEISRAFIYQ
jgi:hypothetical protein